MFRPVSPKLNVVLMEEGILRFWKSRQVFQKSLEQNANGLEYVFYEGPPTANGRPGVHHALARSFKDLFPRYKTMRGYHVYRRGGWDTHGLPVEIEVEKRLEFSSKGEIEDYGIEKFNALCRQSAFAYIQEWERFTNRLGYWVDLRDAYVTYENRYIESVWWILKDLWDRDLLYQGFKVVPYCPRCGTPLSDHEVAQGYAEATDPSVFVRLPLVDHSDTSLLVWTTTPWTLPANVAVAANPTTEYATVERDLPDGGQERLILARALVGSVFGDEPVRIIETYKGSRLKGKRYKPLFTFVPPEKPAYNVALADFVTTEDGTGLVHIAPAYGLDDMQLANENDLPMIMTVGEDGRFTSDVRPWSGQFVKDADPLIIKDLDARGLLFKSADYAHTYPFCWRCSTPLLYYARPTWFVRTSSIKEQMIALNQKINWYPEHIKNGRFGNWLENNVDWALGRERYWGTPLPVWECRDCRHQLCIGSVDELSKLAGKDLSTTDLHRPYIDQVILSCPECGGAMERVPELIDVWFDSGSMPVAQWHYPFENQETFKEHFPADFICEAVDQTRGWFYSLHAISTMLFNQEAFKNAIVLGLILDGEGYKMSKSRGNIVDPWDVLNTQGADAFRWYLYTASPPGQERRFSAALVSEVVRNFTLTIWNTYAFFVTYANLDGWLPTPEALSGLEYSPLDHWLLSSLHALVRDVTTAYETYDVVNATRPIEQFMQQLSNWYVRRSRRRFWKSEADRDKQAAYGTLYQALVTVSKLLAPAMPFLSEEVYQNLVRIHDDDAPLSIHLCAWPTWDANFIDDDLNQQMQLVMKLASLGHAARNKANRKVRQPLAEAAFLVGTAGERETVEKFAELLADELNVKRVRLLSAASEAASYRLNPLPKQLGKKYGSRFSQLRRIIMELPVDETALSLLAGESLHIVMDESTIEVLPEEVEVRVEARAGFAVAAEGPYLAALVTELTHDLMQEGLAREFIRRVQDLRKQAELEVSDRIEIIFQASQGLVEAVAAYRDTILAETLARDLTIGEVPAGFPTTSDQFDGERVVVGIKKPAER